MNNMEPSNVELTNVELDKWHAEHTFGYAWLQGFDRNNLLPPHIVKHGHSIGMSEGRNPNRGDVITDLLPVSSDPAASKQLRDRMREKGWDFSMVDDREDRLYEARFRQRGKDLRCTLFIWQSELEFRAVSLACRAALMQEGR